MANLLSEGNHDSGPSSLLVLLLNIGNVGLSTFLLIKKKTTKRAAIRRVRSLAEVVPTIHHLRSEGNLRNSVGKT